MGNAGTQVPVVVSLHEPTVEPGGLIRCRMCGCAAPCDTWKRQILAQCDNQVERVGAFMTFYYLRAISHPALRNLARDEAHQRFLGWIADAVRVQQAVEVEWRRRVEATSTGAQRAIGRIRGWFEERRNSRLTPHSGMPTQGRHREPVGAGRG